MPASKRVKQEVKQEGELEEWQEGKQKDDDSTAKSVVKQESPATTTPSSAPPSTYPSTVDTSLRMSYRIARGEQGVLTFEPYKSMLLPLWRFRTPPIAQASSTALWDRFLDFDARDDFVGMDMTRKFIQMGMTRAKRYANHAGGRKYGKDGKELEKSQGHADKSEKEESSAIFREVWERCRQHEGYLMKKDVFQTEQKAWDKTVKKEERVVKDEAEHE
jgi:hypothetical protein